MAKRDLDVSVLADPFLDKVEIEQSIKLNKDDIINYLASAEEQRLTAERDRLKVEYDELNEQYETLSETFNEQAEEYVNKTVGTPAVLKALETFFGVPFQVNVDAENMADSIMTYDARRKKHGLVKELGFRVTLEPKGVRRKTNSHVDGEMEADRSIPWTEKLKEQAQKLLNLQTAIDVKQTELQQAQRLINDLPTAIRQMRASFVEKALGSTDSGQNLLSALRQITGSRTSITAENLAKQLTTRKR